MYITLKYGPSSIIHNIITKFVLISQWAIHPITLSSSLNYTPKTCATESIHLLSSCAMKKHGCQCLAL